MPGWRPSSRGTDAPFGQLWEYIQPADLSLPLIRTAQKKLSRAEAEGGVLERGSLGLASLGHLGNWSSSGTLERMLDPKASPPGVSLNDWLLLGFIWAGTVRMGKRTEKAVWRYSLGWPCCSGLESGS